MTVLMNSQKQAVRMTHLKEVDAMVLLWRLFTKSYLKIPSVLVKSRSEIQSMWMCICLYYMFVRFHFVHVVSIKISEFFPVETEVT